MKNSGGIMIGFCLGVFLGFVVACLMIAGDDDD